MQYGALTISVITLPFDRNYTEHVHIASQSLTDLDWT